MSRGDVWVASGGGLAGKPRPVVVVQDDSVRSLDSTVVCLITSDDTLNLPFRVKLEPSPSNGLRHGSWVMTDKLYSFRSSQLGKRIGKLDDGDMARVSDGLRKVLGL